MANSKLGRGRKSLPWQGCCRGLPVVQVVEADDIRGVLVRGAPRRQHSLPGAALLPPRRRPEGQRRGLLFVGRTIRDRVDIRDHKVIFRRCLKKKRKYCFSPYTMYTFLHTQQEDQEYHQMSCQELQYQPTNEKIKKRGLRELGSVGQALASS